jgi:hypothetical protein
MMQNQGDMAGRRRLLRYDPTVAYFGRKMFDQDFCDNMQLHSFDLLDYYLDARNASYFDSLINDSDRTQFMLAYLYSKDQDIAAVSNAFDETEELNRGYHHFIEERQKYNNMVINFFKKLDKEIYNNKLSSWVIHKDAYDGTFILDNNLIYDEDTDETQ